MRNLVLSMLVLLALGACGVEQLSTEETCSEANAIVTGSGGESDEEIREVSQQLGELAKKASDPIKDELTLLAEAASNGQEEQDEMMNDPERSAEYEDAYTTVSEVCEF